MSAKAPVDRREDVVALIKSAGFTPAERDNFYRALKPYS
jgi:cyclic dehypoxanthinyl futalosine synthase